MILLLVLLPLYLWPLRGGISAFRGASAVSGAPGDPRNPAAVAGIPRDVWDALMERGAGGGPAGAPKRARNLTMITEHELGTGPGAVDADGPPSLTPDGSRFAVLLTDDPSSGEGSTAVHFSTVPSGDNHQGTGNGSLAFGSGGSPGLPFLGPLNGGGPGVGRGGGGPSVVSLGPISDPDDHGVPAPTPEPATIVLIGSNVALFGAAMLRRRRRRRETDLSG
ncbi:MAG TPA: hypothetical protein VJX92_06800 [Methylomirabilota bacterium]|nr:hypothetical protein [Methylomirabilota bacterium]